ncbi:hypothetical protein B6U80_01940 [Candidatus Pacearchaeota archaeon ex4484_26]|nr:MAG: hypothetical protein B6U80_01940 [Candidatus Pacearchaeota archaeon ex4484_26]
MLDELKKKKLVKMQDRIFTEQNENLQKQLEEQVKMQEQIEMLESIAKQFLTKEAKERYGRLKLVHSINAIKAIALIAQAAQLGQLKEALTDNEFKELLKKIQEGKQEFKFKR